MRDPRVVLDNLASKSKESGYMFERLYRNLYNPGFFYLAYQKMYAREGNMTQGVDEKTVDGMSIERINKLIESLRDESYKPHPARRVYIPKSSGGKRPLGIPSFEDKLVQEVVRSILEAIYERRFSNDSHGFRPKRSCHTALKQCKDTFNGVKWFVEGDIKGFFDNIDHHTLINILRRTIRDEKFLNLIWKFLRAGYVEEWKFHKTYSGTPQGGIISPILSNIYLNELDQYILEYKQKFNKGESRKRNKEYWRIHSKVMKFKKKHKAKWGSYTDEEKRLIKQKYREMKERMYQLPCYDPMDESYRRIRYVRYADDFIIGVIGSKKDAIQIKRDITYFLQYRLKLELSQEKTLITHSSKMARFLSYDLTISRSQSRKKRSDGAVMRSNSGVCQLYLPKEKWQRKLQDLDALKITKDNQWKATHRTYLKDHDDLEILTIYNNEIRGIYNYYKLANNVSVLNKFHYIMQYSMYKTFANKYKTSVKKILNKYNVNGKFGVKYRTKNGEKTALLYDNGFRKQKQLSKTNQHVDVLPSDLIYSSRSSLMDRLRAEKCELCGRDNTPLEMHHVRRLKDVQGKEIWKQHMIARRRKTLALCHICHRDVHKGSGN